MSSLSVRQHIALMATALALYAMWRNRRRQFWLSRAPRWPPNSWVRQPSFLRIDRHVTDASAMWVFERLADRFM